MKFPKFNWKKKSILINFELQKNLKEFRLISLFFPSNIQILDTFFFLHNYIHPSLSSFFLLSTIK